MDKEIWKDIKGYEGQYQVSSLGRIKSLDYKKTGVARLMKLEERKNGLYVMTKDFKRHEVHRLVAQTFIDGYKEDMEIHHKDGDITNNDIENLECDWPSQFVNLKNEIWRNVVGFEGRYQVSNMGRVRSFVKYARWQKVPRLMKTRPNGQGYLMVMLKKGDGCFKSDVVHRLVAHAFVEGYREDYVVNHKDENKVNNRADNLEWIGCRENTLYGTAICRMEAKVLAEMAHEVERVDEKGVVIASYKSISAASRSTGLSISAIKARCRRHAEGWRMKGDTCILPAIGNEMCGPEVWRDIEGYEGHYQVSNLGRVKAMARFIKSGCLKNCIIPEKILKPRPMRNGRLSVSLALNGKQKNAQIHRLVANAFLVKPNKEYDQVNHKDENPKNNYVGNLEWCTAKYNSNYGVHHLNNQNMSQIIEKRNKYGLYGAEKPVICFDIDGCIISQFRSINEAARIYKISSSHISACCRGMRKSAGGYKWMFEEKQS